MRSHERERENKTMRERERERFGRRGIRTKVDSFLLFYIPAESSFESEPLTIIMVLVQELRYLNLGYS